MQWYVKAHSDIDKAVPFLAGYKPLQPIPPYKPGTVRPRSNPSRIAKDCRVSIASAATVCGGRTSEERIMPAVFVKQKAEKDVQAVIDKIKKESMAERNKALDDARTAALKYHENVTIHV